MVRKVINIVAVLILIFFSLLVPFTSIISGTSVSFQSSDGQWSDSESLGKGRKFETVVMLFEAYKIKCNVSNATLQRTTPKPENLTLENFFNDYEASKWQVPLATMPAHRVNTLGPDCNRNGLLPEQRELASKRAKTYIDSLTTHH